MTTSELTTLLTGLWAKVKSHVTTAINGLAAVATSGSYNDLTNKPTIPDTSTLATKSELTNYCPIIEDTRQSNSQALTGVAPFGSLVDGQRIILNKLKFTIVNNPTLQLTLSNGTQTEAIPMWCDYAGGSALKIGWGGLVHSGGVIELLYEESNNRWVLIGQLDTNTTYAYMLKTHIDNSSSTYQVVSAALLRSNFYLKSETDVLMQTKLNARTVVNTSTLAADTYNVLGTTDSVTVTLPSISGYIVTMNGGEDGFSGLTTLMDSYNIPSEDRPYITAIVDGQVANSGAQASYPLTSSAKNSFDALAADEDFYADVYQYGSISSGNIPNYSAADEFVFSFVCITDHPNITLPPLVELADGFDWSEAGAGVKFQVSIQDNIAAYLTVTPNT